MPGGKSTTDSFIKQSNPKHQITISNDQNLHRSCGGIASHTIVRWPVIMPFGTNVGGSFVCNFEFRSLGFV